VLLPLVCLLVCQRIVLLCLFQSVLLQYLVPYLSVRKKAGILTRILLRTEETENDRQCGLDWGDRQCSVVSGSLASVCPAARFITIESSVSPFSML
jgi:hypothetical protein